MRERDESEANDTGSSRGDAERKNRSGRGESSRKETGSSQQKPSKTGITKEKLKEFLDNTTASDHQKMKTLKAFDKGKPLDQKLLGLSLYRKFQTEIYQPASSERVSQNASRQWQVSPEREASENASSQSASPERAAFRYEPLHDEDDDLVEMNKKHPYFTTRYKISTSAGGRLPYYCSELKDPCVVEVAMMLLRDQGIYTDVFYVAKKIKGNPSEDGYDDKIMPCLFKEYEEYGAIKYEQIPGSVTIEELQAALESGYAIGVGVKRVGEEHMLVVDAIDEEFVYIRDSFFSDPNGQQYCVTKEDFMEARPYDAMVPA